MSELSHIPDETLTKAGVKLVVIGCGHHDLIPNYRSRHFHASGFWLFI